MSMAERLLDLLFPRRAVCLSCGTMVGLDRDDLCEECRVRLARNWIGVKEVSKRSKLAGTAYTYRYESPAGALVRNLKYRSVRVLAPEMSRDLARAAEFLHIAGLDAVTAVPMPEKRLRQRGFNQAELLARGVAETLGCPYVELLRRTRSDVRQAGLSGAERRRNLKGAFVVCDEAVETVRGMNVLLIDDVCTTGSTARSCAEALLKAGAAKVYFAAYTRAEE